MQLPAGLQADSLDQKPDTSPTLRQTIGIAHLKGQYYWSIILLTRPFLIFKVSSKLKRRKDGEDGSSVTTTLSEACIDAALRGIEIANDLVHTPDLPTRMFMITNSVFISAQVIGFAIFGDFDRTFPLLKSITQGIAILNIMAKDDIAARRYFEITSYLKLAAVEHIKRRDQTEIQKRRQDIHNIFGDPVNESSGEGGLAVAQSPSQAAAPNPGRPAAVPSLGTANAIETTGAPPWQLPFDMSTDFQGPVLTTSGALAYNGEDATDPTSTLPRADWSQLPETDYLSPNGSGIPSLPSYAEEFPLFSLMTDYEFLPDNFSSMEQNSL
jgi:hypothetical protein